METIKLGEYTKLEGKRDAFHIAVVQAVSDQTLLPGTHVGIKDWAQSLVGLHGKPVGIVDPYLQGEIRPGTPFWLCLYPGTVTGMTHKWAHPAFPEHEIVVKLNQDSVKWLTDFAAGIDMDYESLIAGCKNYIESYDQIACSKMEFTDLPDGFWDHFEAATGLKARDKKETPFACCI